MILCCGWCVDLVVRVYMFVYIAKHWTKEEIKKLQEARAATKSKKRSFCEKTDTRFNRSATTVKIGRIAIIICISSCTLIMVKNIRQELRN